MKKFIETINSRDYEVLTDSGFKNIKKSHKTIEYNVWVIKTPNLELRCADNHIVFNQEFDEVYVKDLSISDRIQTENGLEEIISIKKTDDRENMYDLELDCNSDRRYYTNKILSHNTMTLSSLAAGFVNNGHDTLYITLEMAEEKIARLIDANLMDIKINEVQDMDRDDFVNHYRDRKNKKGGRLFVREFPTTTAGTSIFRALLDDLKYKKEFEPKIIIVDYINIMKCDRFSDSNSYTMVKSITEELRGLAVDGNYCIVSATQTNRAGAQNSDIDMTDTAESYGLPQTVDLLIGLLSSDILREKNLLIMKSLKNRLNGIVGYKFPVKTNFEYAQTFDCDPDHEFIVQNGDDNKDKLEKERIKDKLSSFKVNNNKDNKKPTEGLFD